MARVFFAFPHRFDEEHPNYRVALKQACQDQKHEAVFASAVPASGHVLQHVHECIDSCEAAFFDITGLNPSVLVEFGLAYAAGKSAFVLLNEEEHVKAGRINWGRQSYEPLEIPADLTGIIRTHYKSTFDLRQSLNKTLEQYYPSKPEVLPLASTVLKHLARFGPLPMVKIASDVDSQYETVRPVVLALVATHQIETTGAGRWTKYGLPSKSTEPPITLEKSH